MKYDVIIIGCGPAGLAAARLLGAAGKKILCVDPDHWGGTCLNEGCIPTKFLLAATAPGEALDALSRQKVLAGAVRINYDNLQARSRRRVAALKESLKSELESLGVTALAGRAVFADGGKLVLRLGDGQITRPETDWIIIAAGSRPAFFPALTPDHETIIDSSDALRLKEIPRSLCVVGSGAVGLEFASFFRSAGASITLVEAAPRLAPAEDDDVGSELAKSLKKRGYVTRVGVSAAGVELKAGGAELVLADGEKIFAEKILVAVGRAGLGPELEAEKAGLAVNRAGYIAADDNLLAGERIFALGDINGRVLLAHAAAHQGAWAARKILGQVSEPYAPPPIPACVFGAPEIMRAGLSAREAAELGGKVEVSSAPFAANPMTQAAGEPGGFVKATWLNGSLVGLAAIGASAADLAAAAELLVAGNYGPDKLEDIMIAHPTLAESLVDVIRGERATIK